jgi:transposase-like protein
MEENVKRNGKKKLSVEEKWRIYQEASSPGAQVGVCAEFGGNSTLRLKSQ